MSSWRLLLQDSVGQQADRHPDLPNQLAQPVLHQRRAGQDHPIQSRNGRWCLQLQGLQETCRVSESRHLCAQYSKFLIIYWCYSRQLTEEGDHLYELWQIFDPVNSEWVIQLVNPCWYDKEGYGSGFKDVECLSVFSQSLQIASSTGGSTRAKTRPPKTRYVSFLIMLYHIPALIF